jgi:hypothetical protein
MSFVPREPFAAGASNAADLARGVQWVTLPGAAASPATPKQRPTHAEVFPADEPLARFIVAMAMARSDIALAMEGLVANISRETPTFIYYHRLLVSHLFEAIAALDAYRKTYPEVKNFLKNRLDAEAREQLATAQAWRRRFNVGLKHVRSHSFHYPQPSPKYDPDGDALLGRHLERVASQPVDLDTDDNVGSFVFALWAMAGISLRRDTLSSDAFEAELSASHEGAAAFRKFVERAFVAYLRLKNDSKL